MLCRHLLNAGQSLQHERTLDSRSDNADLPNAQGRAYSAPHPCRSCVPLYIPTIIYLKNRRKPHSLVQATLSNLPRHELQAVHWSRRGGETVYGIASAPILAMAAFGLPVAARYVTSVLEKAFLKPKRFSASERNPSCCKIPHYAQLWNALWKRSSLKIQTDTILQ